MKFLNFKGIDFEAEKKKILAEISKTKEEVAEESRQLFALMDRTIIIDVKLLEEEPGVPVKVKRFTTPQVNKYLQLIQQVDSRLLDPEKASAVQLSQEQKEAYRRVIELGIAEASGLTPCEMPDSDALKDTLFWKIMQISMVSQEQLERIEKFRADK